MNSLASNFDKGLYEQSVIVKIEKVVFTRLCKALPIIFSAKRQKKDVIVPLPVICVKTGFGADRRGRPCVGRDS